MWDLPLSIADAIVKAKDEIVDWAIGLGGIAVVVALFVYFN